MGTRFQPGSCCGCGGTGPISVEFCYSDCQTGTAIPGIQFEVLNGGTSLGTCTTASNGCCFITISTGAGTYTVKVTDGGNVFTLLTPLSVGTFNYSRNFVEVLGCSGLAAQGVPVTITPGSGRTLSNTSLTTDAAGKAYFPYDASGSFGYATTSPRFNNTSGTTTTCPVVTLTPATGYQCLTCTCGVPVCNTLQLTDSVLGTTNLTSTGGNVWTGTLPYSSPGTCGCPAGSGTISYTFSPCAGVGTPVFSASYDLGPGNTIPCGPGYTPGCGGTPSYGPVGPGFTGHPGDSCGPPFTGVFQAGGCGPCSYCYSFGNKYAEGCGNNNSPWGAVSTITVTILDTCP